MKVIHRTLSALFALALALPAVAQLEDGIDPTLPRYEPVSGISGNLTTIGSDTLANIVTRWAEIYQRIYPGVNLQVQATGSSTAPPSLIEGTSNANPMSRLMKTGELARFEARYGYQPTGIAVAVDALSVFVHQDNPVTGLTYQQLDAIFSANRNCGLDEPIRRWGQIGLEGDWADRDIQLFGRDSVSGTYAYFKERALCGGDYAASVNEQPGSASVVQSVGASPAAIGYSGIGYRTASIRVVPIARRPGDPFVMPSRETAMGGAYPLARLLYIYVNKPPDEDLQPLTEEFIRLALSAEGQEQVLASGFYPLPAFVARNELEKVVPSTGPLPR